MTRDYLVFFVVEEADDDLAAAIRDGIRVLAGARAWATVAPGWFDDGGEPRTAGGFLRVEGAPDPDDVAAVYAHAISLSGRHDCTVELQWREEILGRVVSGLPDPGLTDCVLEL